MAGVPKQKRIGAAKKVHIAYMTYVGVVEEGLTLKAIADRYGVTSKTVRRWAKDALPSKMNAQLSIALMRHTGRGREKANITAETAIAKSATTDKEKLLAAAKIIEPKKKRKKNKI